MADRYQDRPLNADGHGRGGDQHQRAESDPLAELARLIGQNDPLAPGRGNPSPLTRAVPPNQYQPPAEEDRPAASSPPWMRRANPQEIPRDAQREPQREPQNDLRGGVPDFQDSPHPLHRYGTQPPPFDLDAGHQGPALAEAEEEPDPGRYDEALYGQINTGTQDDDGRDPAFPDDPYAFQDGYEDEIEEPEHKRRGGLLTVVAVLALAVFGVGAAYAYRTYVGSPRSGELPIIKADNTPTKIMPAPPDSSAKVPDRLAMGDGTEKLVPREEAPVDVNSRSIGGGPRVVFPQLNQNSNPPTPSSVSPNAMPPQMGPGGVAPSNGTLTNNEPRRIRTLSVRGDQPDAAAAPPPATKPAAAAKTAARTPPSSANANASASSPIPLSPQSAQDSVPPPSDQRARVAAANPAQTAPAASAASSGASGGYMVQVSSQRSEGDAQASYKALQTKFPAALGAHDPVINRADLGDKGIVYQARVGPFGSRDEALQFCVSLKSAGGQCFVPKN